MVEIGQFRLQALFANPAEFYELMLTRKGYTPKQVVEFDVELVAPGWMSMGRVILAALVHHERRAYVVMLDSGDLTAMRETLETQQLSLNYSELANPRRLDSGF